MWQGNLQLLFMNYNILKPKKIIKILKEKGFQLDRIKGSHHIYYHPTSKKRVIVPVHKKELPKLII